MSKIEAGKFELNEERVDVPQLLRACQTMVQARADNGGIALVANLPGGLPTIWADGRALKQVILNLLSNAVKFTAAGGRVMLSAAWTPDGIALSVADNGIGIPPEALARIVRPFGQADASISRRFGGTGLGLPISKRLIELHGGTLTIDSALNSGTTVTVMLPVNRAVSDGSRLAAT
jgi:signal transduction histidine kinase